MEASPARRKADGAALPLADVSNAQFQEQLVLPEHGHSQDGLTSLELVESGQLEMLLQFSHSYGEEKAATDADTGVAPEPNPSGQTVDVEAPAVRSLPSALSQSALKHFELQLTRAYARCASASRNPLCTPVVVCLQVRSQSPPAETGKERRAGSSQVRRLSAPNLPAHRGHDGRAECRLWNARLQNGLAKIGVKVLKEEVRGFTAYVRPVRSLAGCAGLGCS